VGLVRRVCSDGQAGDPQPGGILSLGGSSAWGDPQPGGILSLGGSSAWGDPQPGGVFSLGGSSAWGDPQPGGEDIIVRDITARDIIPPDMTARRRFISAPARTPYGRLSNGHVTGV
jgi:hypothetical protein